MPGQGWGGLLTNLFNPGLDQQIAASITPNPSPLAQQDQPKVPPVPGAPSNPAPGQAPPQVTQGDPALMQTNQLLMQGYLNSQRADAINRGIGQISAGFGTAQQQASKQAALAGGGGQGSGASYLDAIAKMQGIDQQQTSQTEHARAAANMQVLAKALGLPDTPEGTAQATEIWNSGMLPDFGRAAASNTQTTQEQKNFGAAQQGAAQQVKIEHPDWTPDQIQQEVNKRVPPSLLMSGVGTPADQEYNQYAAAERAAGRTPLGPVEWNEKQKVSGVVQETKAEDATKFIAAGSDDFDNVHAKYTKSRDRIKSLLGNMDATMSALKYPSLLTTSGLAAGLPDWNVGGYGLPDEATKQAAVDAQGLVSDLTGESLSTVKNLRNRTEFTTLGTSATAGLNANKGRAGVQQTLKDMLARLDTSDANAYAVAGRQIPNQYAGKADERYLNKTLDGRDNPYYTGATYAPADSKTDSGGGGGGKPLDATAMAKARDLISKHGRDYVIKYLTDNGYDPSGL